MPPKKNAFFNFMVKRRKELEAQGQTFAGGWNDVSVYVSEEWAKMSLDDKRPFMPDKGTSSFPSIPLPVSHPACTQRKETYEENKGSGSCKQPERLRNEPKSQLGEEMMKTVKEGREMYFSGQSDTASNTFGGKTGIKVVLHKKVICFQHFLETQIIKRICAEDWGNIRDMPIILITCNSWCKSIEDKIIPSEIALLAFSIRSGVLDQYCTPIDPGTFPPGFGYEAAVEADKLFFPMPPFDKEYRNYSVIGNNILAFIDKHNDTNNKAGFVFCLRQEMQMIYGCLQWILDKAGVYHNFELYPFEFLVMKLWKFGKIESLLRTEEIEDRYCLPSALDSFFSGSKKSNFEGHAYCATVSTSYASTQFNVNVTPSIDEEKVFNSEKAVLRCIEGLKFCSVDYLGCLHHMFYSDVVYRCALNRLNRYVFHTLDALALNFSLIPLNGVNFIDTQFSNPDELDKRQKMLKSWGLRFKPYPGYSTPFERENLRAAEIVRLNELEQEEGYNVFDEDDPAQVPVMFRQRREIPEFVPIDSAYASLPLQSNLTHSVDWECFSSSSNINDDNDEISPYFENDNDGWTYAQKN